MGFDLHLISKEELGSKWLLIQWRCVSLGGSLIVARNVAVLAAAGQPLMVCRRLLEWIHHDFN